MGKTRWGVLGVAKIATNKVIPAMQNSNVTEVVAIASRDLSKAQSAAANLGIARAYGTYEELLGDPEVECIYNPLPNHLHVPWSIRAAEAGKHVLCEKPIAMSVAECRQLMDARDRAGVRLGEAFMVRTHPQWLRAREIVRERGIGDLRAVVCAFSYFNRDPANVRNVPEWGGGGLMDIGCYPIQISRFLFETEPVRVSAAIEYDPDFDVDRLTSGLLDYERGHCVFTCSTQMTPYQRVHIFGTSGRVEIEIPFNAPPDRPCRLWIEREGRVETEEMPVCDQYTIQGDAFSLAVREGGEVPTPLEDSIRNMAVIEAMFRSAAERAQVVVTSV
jgi:predicted dehydrogenase